MNPSSQPMSDVSGMPPTSDTHAMPASFAPNGGVPSPSQLKHQAQATLGQVGDSLQQQIHTQANAGLAQAAQTMDGISQAVRDLSGDLRDRPQSAPIAEYADSAADQLQHLSTYLRKDAGDIVQDVRSYARRQPTVLLLGAFALGFLGARFLKSSGTATNQPNTRSQDLVTQGVAQMDPSALTSG